MLADGIVSGATGILLALAAGPLADLLGLPALLLRLAGLSLLPFAALVVYLATRAGVRPRLTRVIVGLNLLWAVGSLLLLLSGWVEPTLIGTLFTIAQALAVASFAGLQYRWLGRSA